MNVSVTFQPGAVNVHIEIVHIDPIPVEVIQKLDAMIQDVKTWLPSDQSSSNSSSE